MLATARTLARDESGKLPFKLVFGTCLLSVAVAKSSPVFEANPLVGNTVNEVRKHLPETFDKITRAMGGEGSPAS